MSSAEVLRYRHELNRLPRVPHAHSAVRTLFGIVGAAALVAISSSSVGCSSASRTQDPRIQAALAHAPADHDALANLFLVRASEYEADARYHRDLAARYQESGDRLWYRHHDRSELRMAEHCQAVADDLVRAAAALREAAAEHARLAGTDSGASE